MACSLEYVDFVLQQLSGVGSIEVKKMFGEYCIYVDERPVILACDNTCFVKKVEEIKALMIDAECGFPYPGAKEQYILDIEHKSEAVKIVRILSSVLPYPKPKKKKTEIEKI